MFLAVELHLGTLFGTLTYKIVKWGVTLIEENWRSDGSPLSFSPSFSTWFESTGPSFSIWPWFHTAVPSWHPHKSCPLSEDDCHVSSSPRVSDQSPQDSPTQSSFLGPNMCNSMELSFMVNKWFFHFLAVWSWQVITIIFNLSESFLSSLKWANSNFDLIRQWCLNEKTHIKYFAWYLACCKL